MRTGALSLLPFNLTQTFFGYKPADAIELHDQLFEFVWMSEGKFDWDTVYKMPLWLRRTTMNLLREHYEQQKEAMEKQQNLLKNNKKNEVARPNIAPTYTAKVPKK